MRRIVLFPPRVTGRIASFRFAVEPASELYKTTSFTLTFPESVDLTSIPTSLWWTVFFLCLHSHWVLLRPCAVRLPVTLRPGERELWLRLLDSYVATLEAYRGGMDVGGVARSIDIVEDGPPLPPVALLVDEGRCASAFSGGKDSLLQAALLCELTARPVLVTTTSPMPPLHDHQTPRRRRVLAEIALRRDVTHVEVGSDLRSIWRNDFPPRVGYPVSVNEITDTHLYTASMLIAGTALGATHLFLASEAEVQQNGEVDGRVVQHPHFMYSAATQGAIAALLRPFGVRYGSLLTALPSVRVQQLLWTRYPDLSDLQYSCWRVGPEQATCSACGQCLRVAMIALALGRSPETMGIDLPTLLVAQGGWKPRGGSGGAGGALPKDAVTAGLQGETMRAVAATPVSRMLRALVAGNPWRLLSAKSWRAFFAYARMRRRLLPLAPQGEPPGYAPGFLRATDELLRDRLTAVFSAALPAEDERAHAEVLARSAALSAWIVRPLAAVAAAVGAEAAEP